MTDHEDFAEALTQMPVVSAAWKFLVPFYTRKDLGAAWPYADEVLRICWAQWWVEANRAELEAHGHDLEEAVHVLATGQGRQGLWQDFQRVIVRDFHRAFPLDPEKWGIGTAPRLVAPDIELLYVHAEVPASGVWAPGASAKVVPVLMRLTAGEWRVLNFGYERIPEPGWPPKLW